jgi:hypothetical protein
LLQHVADLRVALTLAYAALVVGVEAELVLFQGADRHLDQPLAVAGDDRVLADDVGEVFLDRLFDLLLVAGLVGHALAVQRPVIVAE